MLKLGTNFAATGTSPLISLVTTTHNPHYLLLCSTSLNHYCKAIGDLREDKQLSLFVFFFCQSIYYHDVSLL